MEYTLIGALVFIASIYALYHIITSPASTGKKALWALLVLILPVLGVIIWFFAGPRNAPASV